MPQKQKRVVKEVAEKKPRMVRVFKTAVFKIHNPTQHKRAMLRDAMKHAHITYGKLLERRLPDKAEIDHLKSLPRRDYRLAMMKNR